MVESLPKEVTCLYITEYDPKNGIKSNIGDTHISGKIFVINHFKNVTKLLLGFIFRCKHLDVKQNMHWSPIKIERFNYLPKHSTVEVKKVLHLS